MEGKAQEPVIYLDLKQPGNNDWNKKDYENIKKAKGKNSIRGSLMIKDVVSNLRLRPVKTISVVRLGEEAGNDNNNNTIYQKNYGDSYAEHLEKNRVNFRQLLNMRKSSKDQELLDLRARMADWMIEVFTVYHTKGSNEYTYFKALIFIDYLIDQGHVNADNLHIYGIAAMFLASNILDRTAMTIDDAYRDLAHKSFRRDNIMQYVNRAIAALGFNFRMPTWIEYLDKAIYDIFGDYRDDLAQFNIRQTAVFVLHACAYDTKFYGQEPFYFATTALLYAINTFFLTYDVSVHSNSLEQLQARGSKDEIVNHILTATNINRASMKQSLLDLAEYLQSVKLKIKDSTFKQLTNLFHFDLDKK